MDRSRGGDRGHARRHGGHPPGRRIPPPPHTGLEAVFFDSAQRSRTPLVFTLADGRKVVGTVQEFDRDQITVEDSSGPIVIRKSDIRYVGEDG